MKKSAGIFLFFFAMTIFSSCKKDPAAQQMAGPNSNPASVPYRKVLLESFHGHTCPNTTGAQVLADSLLAIYDTQLVSITIHAGWFAEPCPPHPLPNGAPAGSFSTNLISPAGNAIDQMTNGSSAPPVGMINRRGFSGNWYLANMIDWKPRIDSLLLIPTEVSIHLSAQIDTSTNLIDVQATGDFLSAQNGTFSLAVMLVEDSITGWQIDGTNYVPNYIFRNVLRSCLTDPVNATGVVVGSGSIAAMTPFNHSISNFALPLNVTSVQRIYAIAFVYNDATKEILQVEKTPVIF